MKKLKNLAEDETIVTNAIIEKIGKLLYIKLIGYEEVLKIDPETFPDYSKIELIEEVK